MEIKNLYNYGTIVDKIEGVVYIGTSTTSTTSVKNEEGSETLKEGSFYDIVQYENPTQLVERLHQLIDGRKGADVRCVLLKCLQDGYLIRRPKQREFESEFSLIGGWAAVHKYMSDNNENALDRANKIIIF